MSTLKVHNLKEGSGSVVKNLPANVGDTHLIPRSGRSPEERNGNSPGKSYGQRSLVGYSSWQGVGHD